MDPRIQIVSSILENDLSSTLQTPDGTFVGPDTSNFFTQTKAVIDAKRDFLNELTAGLSNSGEARDSFYAHLQETAAQPIDFIYSSSTQTDYYNYFKKLSVSEFLETKKRQGEDKAIARALRPRKKPWAKLRKKD